MSLFAVMVTSNWLISVSVPVSDGLTIQTFIRFVHYFIRISQWNNKPPGITKVPKYKIQDTSQPIQGSTNQKKLISRKNYHRKEAFSLVGTPNYIAPEVLQVILSWRYKTQIQKFYRHYREKISKSGQKKVSDSKFQACAQPGGGYTKSCDWWSVGVILFEMVIGYAPFHATTPQQTQEKILAVSI